MKKKFAGWMAVLTAAVLLTGCGNDTDKPLNEMKVEKYVDPGDYNNLSVTVDAVQVDEEEWNALVNEVYVSGISAEHGGIVDRPVELGDTVVIDYEGKKDGIAFGGGTAQGADLAIGSGQFIAGFEDGLVGVMPGETVDLNLTFPEGYGNTELAGQAVVFTVTVHYIRPKEVAVEDMEDAVVAALGIEDVKTVEQLRQYTYDYLYTNAETNYSNNLMNGILDTLLEQCVFQELPEELVESYRLIMEENIKANAAAYNVDAETFSNYFFGTTSAELAEMYAGEALKQNLALQAIANAEGLKISDEELQQKLEEYTAEAGAGSVEEFLGENSREEYRNYFMNEKVMEYLQEKANIIENQ